MHATGCANTPSTRYILLLVRFSSYIQRVQNRTIFTNHFPSQSCILYIIRYVLYIYVYKSTRVMLKYVGAKKRRKKIRKKKNLVGNVCVNILYILQDD